MTITADALVSATQPVDLLAEQQRTRATPSRRAGFLARSLFVTMDLLYGRRRTLEKFLVLELAAVIATRRRSTAGGVSDIHRSSPLSNNLHKLGCRSGAWRPSSDDVDRDGRSHRISGQMVHAWPRIPFVPVTLAKRQRLIAGPGPGLRTGSDAFRAVGSLPTPTRTTHSSQRSVRRWRSRTRRCWRSRPRP
jgi:hypothetical protein